MAVERILSITGEDPVSVNRKNKSLLTIRLPLRFLLVSNELPKMQDESGALRTRMLMLRLRKTVDEARRDNRLTEKLIAELPGILNWALDGLARVSSRRAFAQPKSAEEDLDLMANLSSPTKAFLEECCHVDPMATISKKDLFQLWRTWCEKTNTMPGNETHFARNLYATVADIRAAKPYVDGKRVPHYSGIRISETGDDMLRAFGVVSWPGINT
jgi:putative DNA primase/helicase